MSINNDDDITFKGYFAEFLKMAVSVLLEDINFETSRKKMLNEIYDKNETEISLFTIIVKDNKGMAFNHLCYSEISKEINDKLGFIGNERFFKSISLDLMHPIIFGKDLYILFKLESNHDTPIITMHVVNKKQYNEAKSQYSSKTLCKLEKSDKSCIIV